MNPMQPVRFGAHYRLYSTQGTTKGSWSEKLDLDKIAKLAHAKVQNGGYVALIAPRKDELVKLGVDAAIVYERAAGGFEDETADLLTDADAKTFRTELADFEKAGLRQEFIASVGSNPRAVAVFAGQTEA